MQGAGIRFGIDCDGTHAEALRGARDTAGNFPAVSDEDGAQHLAASERVTVARSTHCAAGAWPALACGGDGCGGAAGCGPGIGAMPGAQTGSTGGTKVADGGGVAAGGGELPALREDRRADDAARASPAPFAGASLGSGFIMLTAGIEAALGKLESRITFFWAWLGGGWLAASVAVEDGAASATGVSGCPHNGK